MAIWRSLLFALLLIGVAQAEDAALRWQFRTGDTHDYRMTQTAKLELDLAGDNKVVTEVDRVFDFNWSVESVDPNGVATIAIDVTAIRLHVAGPGGQVADYDSTSEDEPHGFAATLVPLFKALLDAKLIAKLNARGELLELQVPEDLETILKTKPAGKAVGQLGAVADFEGLARLGLPVLPASVDFKVGGKWEDERKVDDATIGSIVAHSTYRWESTSDENSQQIARILPSTMFSFAEPKERQPTIGSNEALTSGEILFNVTAGRLELAKRTESMTLSTSTGGEPTAGTLEHTLMVERMAND